MYILTNFTNTTLYVGITNNLERRIWEHKNGINEGFTKRYNLRKASLLRNFYRTKARDQQRKTAEKLAPPVENESYKVKQC